MRYTKEDFEKVKSLVKELNKILVRKFACNKVNIGIYPDKSIWIDIYEKLDSSTVSKLQDNH